MWSFEEIQTSTKQEVAGKIAIFELACSKGVKIKTDNLLNNFEPENKGKY